MLYLGPKYTIPSRGYVLEQRHALGTHAVEHELPATLKAHQWGLIENVLTLLAPFKELTKEISSLTATAADVIPAITALKWLLEKRADTDRGVGTTKTTLLSENRRVRKGSATLKWSHIILWPPLSTPGSL